VYRFLWWTIAGWGFWRLLRDSSVYLPSLRRAGVESGNTLVGMWRWEGVVKVLMRSLIALA
jgi:hypothetical protein